MKNLLSTVSTRALFYQANKDLKQVRARIPVGWDVSGFPEVNVYVRKLNLSERNQVLLSHKGQLFDWSREWHGLFSVKTGEMVAVSDSVKKMRKQMAKTIAVEVYLN